MVLDVHSTMSFSFYCRPETLSRPQVCVLVDFAQGGREVGYSSLYCVELPSASEVVSSEDIDGVSTAHVFKKRASTVLV